MGSYRDLWTARWRLLRPGNAAMAAIGVVIGALLVAGTADLAFVPAALAAAFITAAGNIVNDIVDRHIDIEVHPERPLPSGHITPRQAQVFAVLLLAFGLWEAYLAAGPRTLLFAAVNASLLVAYEARLKHWGLPGNVVVAGLVASTFLFGAASVSSAWPSWGLVWALAGMAFLTNVARELLKDIQDLEGDREDRRTFPMRAGRPVTLILAFFFVQVAVVLSFLTWWYAPLPAWWGIPLLAAGIAFTAAASIAWVDVRMGQQGLKLGMLLALAAFFAASYAMGNVT